MLFWGGEVGFLESSFFFLSYSFLMMNLKVLCSEGAGVNLLLPQENGGPVICLSVCFGDKSWF